MVFRVYTVPPIELIIRQNCKPSYSLIRTTETHIVNEIISLDC